MMKSEAQVKAINETIEVLNKVLTALTIIRDNDVCEVQVLRDLGLHPATFRRICYDNDWIERDKNKPLGFKTLQERLRDTIPTRDWTEDLFCVVAGLERNPSNCGKIPPDVKVTMVKAIESLTPREQTTIKEYYQDKKTHEEIGKDLGITDGRVQQILMKALRKLRHPSRFAYIVYGDGYYVSKKVEGDEVRRHYQIKQAQEELERLEALIHIKRSIVNGTISEPTNTLLDMDVAALDLSVRSYNCITRAGIHTVRELIGLTEPQLRSIRNLGRKSADEIIETLANRGFYLKDA